MLVSAMSLTVLKGSNEYTKVQLSPWQKEVTIFVNLEDESQFTTESTTESGLCNSMLAKFNLDRLNLSAWNKTLRIFGRLTTLYIRKMKEL